MNRQEIAVIGIACNFSRSENLAAFWLNLRSGEELVQFLTEEEQRQWRLDEALIQDPAYIKIRSVISGKDSFDAPFFGYTREEAALMDPQIRLFHEYVWKALENAGYDPYSYPGSIGLFAGATGNLNWIAHNITAAGGENVDPFFRSHISNKQFLATLVAYKLNLKGPACFVDTACSTSLTAIHLACHSLLMQECDMVLAGAVHIDTSDAVGYQYQPGMIFSQDGHCKTFDAAASGTTSGEGVGIVVLKRLEDALRDGDHIYAVVRSSAANNDGSRKVGYTAPSAAGQAECIMQAHALAGISPGSVSYIEAHGTATRLGDPIEIEALNKAFGYNPEKYCAIGSVKSVLGHLDTAAGVAGFIKTVLALQHREIPPSLHLKNPNPEINFDQGPFYVNTDLLTWERKNNEPLRAGVSAFGIGGTNVHIVLEEAPAQRQHAAHRPYYLLPCTAKTSAALDQQIIQLKSFLQQDPAALADAAWTLQCRRRHFKKRAVLIAGDSHKDETMLASLGKATAGTAPALVFMFSGSGMQYVNMGRELYEQEPVFSAAMDKGFRGLEAITGVSWKEILYGDNNLQQEQINDTSCTQPLIFVFEYALAQLLMHWGIKPQYMIGHSTGELAAACIAGVFSFEDGLQLIVQRSALMSRLQGGAMLGIGLPIAAITPFMNKEVAVAAVNSPEHCVISGTSEGIAAMAERLEQQGISATRLRISIAAHSHMMEPMMDDFRKVVAAVKLSAPQTPLVSNISGKIAGSEILSPDYWSSHVRATVDFSKGICGLLEKEARMLFIEIGPGNTLTTFCQQINKRYPGRDNLVFNLVRHPLEQISDLLLLTERLGLLWLNGVTVNWESYNREQPGKVTALPGYCFDKHKFTTLVNPYALIGQSVKQAAPENATEGFYQAGWKSAALHHNESLPYAYQRYLLFSDESAFAAALKAQLLKNGLEVLEVVKRSSLQKAGPNTMGIDPLKEENYYKLGEWLAMNAFNPDQVIYLWSAAARTTDYHYTDYFALRYLYQALDIKGIKAHKKIFCISSGLYDITGSETGENIHSALAIEGLLASSPENPWIFTCHLDLSLKGDLHLLAESCCLEFRYNAGHAVVAIRNRHRWIPALDRLALSGTQEQILQQQGSYLITGSSAAAAQIADCLRQQYEANVILLDTATSESYAALESTLQQYKKQFGCINGVIHISPPVTLSDPALSAADLTARFDQNVKTWTHLSGICRLQQIDHVWLLSEQNKEGHTGIFTRCCAAIKRREMNNVHSIELTGTPKELTTMLGRALTLTHVPHLVFIAGNPETTRKGRSGEVPEPEMQSWEYDEASDAAEERTELTTEYCEPVTETEKTMVVLWQELFGIHQIGTRDNFFELGGDSLKAMTLSKRVFREFNVNLPVEKYFINPSILFIAKEIDTVLGMQLLYQKSSVDRKSKKIVI